MRRKLRLIVFGILGRDPVAGVAWQVLHYLEGFRRLGHEVYYVEDTGDWPQDAEQDCRSTLTYIARLMDWCGLSHRWAYCAASLGQRVFGLSESQLAALFASADALVNLTGSTRLKEEHLRVPVRIYLETDPGLPQIALAKNNRDVLDFLQLHTHHFSYGENLGAHDCRLPQGPLPFYPTRQPVVLDWWPIGAERPTQEPLRFTTIATWQESGKDITWNGETYTWSKHQPFLEILDLPARTLLTLELALACGDTDTLHLLTSKGWRVVDALALSSDILPYRDYIRGSAAEFTVAKDQYTRLRTGWFSDRSACYLASARPVVTQETGFSKFLPTGQGLFGFETVDAIVEALDTIAADYEANSRAARAVAEEFFAAEKVLGNLIDRSDL